MAARTMKSHQGNTQPTSGSGHSVNEPSSPQLKFDIKFELFWPVVGHEKVMLSKILFMNILRILIMRIMKITNIILSSNLQNNEVYFQNVSI